MLQSRHDYELLREDVQLLASRDAITAFFAKLGYDTNQRLLQNVSAMGIGNDSLKANIRHIERIASQDGGFFEVYLFELRSVTVANTQGIVRALRDRPGDYLLVLTEDYERLDFVLVERFNTETVKVQEDALQMPVGSKQVSVRPRVLTVLRRNPNEVALRVLRRFSYTESDTFAQYDKLVSAYDVADWSEPFFNNRALFSDYYLKERLPHDPIWDNASNAAAMTRAFNALRVQYDDVRETYNNQPLKIVHRQLIEPVLTTLGFVAQPAKPGAHENEIEPHYRLYAGPRSSPAATPPATPPRPRVPVKGTPTMDEGTPGDLSSMVGTPLAGVLAGGGVESRPIALCLAYTWGRNLDGKDDQRDNQTPDENPGAAVVTLLDGGEADWAIVTNGKIWRLYSAKAHSRATNYYEIDVEETLALPAANVQVAFRYFWLLFRANAFIAEAQVSAGEQKEMCFLDSLLSESERYARILGERLKERVFDEIFPHFARGFILHARQTGQIDANLESMGDEERNRLLEPYFNGTLTFLYRMLFLLYAESRDLLPVREVRGYYMKSLERIKQQIAEKAGKIEDEAPANIRTSYHDLSTRFYDELQELFQAVDKGEAALNVPVYNGGLFVTQPDPNDPSPEAAVARFLSTHKILDRELALGLDRMARDVDEKRQDLAFIDYKSLGVRQLGSIYEGLLEFKLRVAPEQMAVVKGKKTEEIVPYAEAVQKKLPIVKDGRGQYATDRTYPKRTVYLENDRRERKATGSYYTPDYIVKYIVEHTVGPVLKEKLEALRPLFRAAEQFLKSKKDREKALQKQHLLTKGDTPENETYKHYRETLNVSFFDLKVLDPAMGSGHFLVEAVDYITDQLAKFLTAFKWNPIVHELAETRREIQKEMEKQEVTVDINKLTDINLLKRQVLKRCIYGVDLNPMAVELAKVSLWLDCFTLGAPLSFLDHHMKAGNSLIGGNVQEVQEALSTNLWSNQFTYLLSATELMRRVGSFSDITAQEVAESRKAYQGAYDALAPFKRLLDVWISEYFGNKAAKHTTRLYAGAIVADDYSKVSAKEKQAIATALELARTKHFFHWELEFPEVFYDAAQRKENGGFDAVVGNPPYVSAPAMVSRMLAERRFLDTRYKLLTMKWDLYCAFIELSCQKLKEKGATGLIIPSQVLYQDYARLLRKELVDNYVIKIIIDFSNVRVFLDATVMTCVMVISKAPTPALNHVVKTLKPRAEILDYAKPFSSENYLHIPQLAFKETPEITFRLAASNVALTSLGDKIQSNCYNLGDICYCSVGVVPHSEKQGKQKEHYIYDYKHDEKCKPYIEGKEVEKYDIDWRGRFLQYDYNVVRRPSLPELLDAIKIILKIVAGKSGLNATIDYSGFYGDHSFVMLTQKYRLSNIKTRTLILDQQQIVLSRNYLLEFILAIINSSLMGWYFQRNLSSDLNIGPDDVKKLPIRHINFTTPPEERAHLLEKAKGLYAYCLTKDEPNCVMGFVEHHLAMVPEQSDVVHDLLAFLAEEMIRLNKEKRALMREFLDWLVEKLRIVPDKDGRKGIEGLTGKSKLADYAGDYQKGEPPLEFRELVEILQKNKGKLGVKLSNDGFVEQLRARYEESLGRVLPLKEQLKKTDRLIDLVVYRLYGLTEEEIGVVEGRG